MQELMIERHAAGGGIYHVQQSFRITGRSPSSHAMRAALDSLIAEHPVLRTVFIREPGGACLQAIMPSGRAVLIEHTLTDLDELRQHMYISRVLEADKTEAFQVGSGAPLYRFHWFHTGKDCCEFLMSIHHAIDDGWGNQHFLQKLFATYRAIVDCHARALSVVRANVFKEFVALERHIARSADAAQFWKSLRIAPSGPEVLERKSPETDGAARYRTTSSQRLLLDLQEVSRRERVSLRAIVLDAYADILRSYTRRDFATIGVVFNGRSERLSDPLQALGLFWNLAPVCIRDRADSSASPQRHVQELLNGIEPYAVFPLREIARLYEVDELFFATLNFTNFHNRFQEEVGDGIRVSHVSAHDRFHYPLNYHVAVYGSGVLGISVEFQTEYFSESTIRDLTERLLARLEETGAVGAKR
jgi:hypothetical protein